MMWTLIIIGLAFVIWRFMQPAGSEAPAASAAPPPPPPPPPAASSGGDDPFKSAVETQSGESAPAPAPQASGEVDPFKAPGK